MQIKTSKGNEYAVHWIDTQVQSPNRLILSMETDMPITQLVYEFDGLSRIERLDENEGNKTFDGYGALTAISRMNHSVQITMERTGSTE